MSPKPTQAIAVQSATSELAPWAFERRDPRPDDVAIDILYCGVCHTDIHQARNEWGGSRYPMVPGHEIVGRVSAVGSQVTRFKVGDVAAVGCMVDACGDCENCRRDLEQFCFKGFVATYNGVERDGKTPTQGGYSSHIVVKEPFVLKVSPGLPLERVAPLLCAGITTYSPLRHWKVGPGMNVGIVGLGGLGHMGVKFAKAFGAHVTVFTTSPSKIEDAKRLGAHEVVLSKDPAQMKGVQGRFHFILDTVSATHDLSALLSCLRTDGTLTLVGVPDKPAEFHSASVIMGRKRLAGSLIGGIRETQEMLDYCAAHGIASDVEVIRAQDVNTAYTRMLKSDVKYRFVLDLGTLKTP